MSVITQIRKTAFKELPRNLSAGNEKEYTTENDENIGYNIIENYMAAELEQ